MGPEDLWNIIQLSPLQRLDRIVEIEPDAAAHVTEMKTRYSWFLDNTGKEKSVIHDWIADPKNRREAFDSGRQFANEMYNLLQKVTSGTDIMRYLVV